MPAMGLEPIRGCPQQILSLPRLPFRHAGIFLTKCILSYGGAFGKRFLTFSSVRFRAILYQMADDSRLFRRRARIVYQWRVSICHLIYALRCAGIRIRISSALQTRIPRQDSRASLEQSCQGQSRTGRGKGWTAELLSRRSWHISSAS